jgi:hypothetical protein
MKYSKIYKKYSKDMFTGLQQIFFQALQANEMLSRIKMAEQNVVR